MLAYLLVSESPVTNIFTDSHPATDDVRQDAEVEGAAADMLIVNCRKKCPGTQFLE